MPNPAAGDHGLPLGQAAARPRLVASQPGPGGARHVGRIVDPLARDDGETEPELQLDAEVSPESTTSGAADPENSAPIAAEEPAEVEEPPVLEAPPEPGQHPIKARLLARAAAARQARSPQSSTDPDPPARARSGLDELDAEVSGPISHRPPSAPAIGRGRPQLSPTLVALFGTLLGLATVASLVALVMGLEPRPWQLNGAEPEPAESAAATPVASAVAPPPVRPKRQKVQGPWRVKDGKDEPGMRFIEGTIGLSPFLRAVQDAGLEKAQAYRVLTALKDLKNLDKCDKTDKFAALVERSTKKVKAFEYIVSAEEIYQAREGKDGLLDGKKLDLKVEHEQIKAAFVIDGSVDDSAQKAGLDPGISAVLAKALDGHMDLEELKRGDVIRVVAQGITVLGEWSRYAGVEALELRPADASAKPLRVYFYRGPQTRAYYDANGRSPYEGGWRKPVKDAPITSHFNPKRMHPILHKIVAHTGTDFGAAAGTPVGASTYGTISFIGPAGPSGNLVKIQHAGGIETGYAHLSRFAEGLKVGDHVTRLQTIGYVGSTGRSTGPHLHFTAKRDGKFFDAETLNLDGMRVLPPSQRDDFAKVKAKYDALLDSIPAPQPLAAPPTEPASATTESAPPDEGPDEPDEPEPAAAPETPRAAAPEPTPAAPAPQNGNPIYLTDKDLQKLQSTSDDGEVAP